MKQAIPSWERSVFSFLKYKITDLLTSQLWQKWYMSLLLFLQPTQKDDIWQYFFLLLSFWQEPAYNRKTPHFVCLIKKENVLNIFEYFYGMHNSMLVIAKSWHAREWWSNSVIFHQRDVWLMKRLRLTPRNIHKNFLQIHLKKFLVLKTDLSVSVATQWIPNIVQPIAGTCANENCHMYSMQTKNRSV